MKKYILKIEWHDGHIEIVPYTNKQLRAEGAKAYKENLLVKKVLQSDL